MGWLPLSSWLLKSLHPNDHAPLWSSIQRQYPLHLACRVEPSQSGRLVQDGVSGWLLLNMTVRLVSLPTTPVRSVWTQVSLSSLPLGGLHRLLLLETFCSCWHWPPCCTLPFHQPASRSPSRWRTSSTCNNMSGLSVVGRIPRLGPNRSMVFTQPTRMVTSSPFSSIRFMWRSPLRLHPSRTAASCMIFDRCLWGLLYTFKCILSPLCRNKRMCHLVGCTLGYRDFNNLVMQTLWWLHQCITKF